MPTKAELEKRVADLEEQLAVATEIIDYWRKEAGECQAECASWRNWSADMEKFLGLEQKEAYWKLKKQVVRPRKRRRRGMTDEAIDITMDV